MGLFEVGASPFAYNQTGGPMVLCFSALLNVINGGVPLSSPKRNDLAWRHWVSFCADVPTQARRFGHNSHVGASPVSVDRELCLF